MIAKPVDVDTKLLLLIIGIKNDQSV